VISVDTDVVASLLLKTADSPKAEQLLAKDRHWSAPRLWRSEYRNVLAKLIRTGVLDLPFALRSWDAAEALFGDDEYELAGFDVLRLARESDCTACDCEYVAVARDLGVPLVTLDAEILAAFPETAVSLGQFLA
jgi:predicted nucleic acid-binding protein